MNRNIEDLIQNSIFILREAKAQFKHICILWSTGKDSTSLLSLCREAFFGKVPFPVLHIDTGKKFEEIYEFRDRLAEEWDLDLRIVKHPLAGKLSPDQVGHLQCCNTLKTQALKQYLEKEGFDAVIVSIRRDEHYMRMVERTFSPRDKDFRWKHLRPKREGEAGDSPFIYEQDAELWNIYRADFTQEISHFRVHPLLHWTELEVWLYVKARNLPYNPLYRADYVEQKYGWKNKRFRSLGCKPCTTPIDSSASTIDEIIQELKTTRTPERVGRVQDKEEEEVMRRLRALGYM